MEPRVTAAARLIRDGAEDTRGARFPQALLDGLAELVGATAVCFSELDLRRRRDISFQCSEPAPPSADSASFWQIYPQLRPCHYLYDGDLVRSDVVLLSDFIPDRVLHSSALYHEYLLPGGERHEMYLPLPTAPGCTRVLVFSRWDGDFTESDRDLMTLLRPHLIDGHRAHHRRLTGVPTLTHRQWQVLHAVAAGHSTEQVAAAMCVSPSTVRKHLENIYGRLGVTSRAAAVGRALGSESVARESMAG